MFMKALDSIGKLDDPYFGTIEPDETVNIVFNLSQGEDSRGPWNKAPFEYVADPEAEGGIPPAPVNNDDEQAKPSGVKAA
jgi:Mn-containing catalase